jgi:hypothetical protein
LTLLAILDPVQTGAVRATIVLGLTAVWAGALVLTWRQAKPRLALLSLSALPIILLVLPDRPVNAELLRTQYVQALRSSIDAPFLHGGETRMGFDGPGLVRANLIYAQIALGLETANPLLLRRATSLWWSDASAAELADEYEGRTIRLATVPSLNDADDAVARPGDLAVTEDNQHVLAYLGERVWVSADPERHRVSTVTVPLTIIDLDTPARILRWRDLTQP